MVYLLFIKLSPHNSRTRHTISKNVINVLVIRLIFVIFINRIKFVHREYTQIYHSLITIHHIYRQITCTLKYMHINTIVVVAYKSVNELKIYNEKKSIAINLQTDKKKFGVVVVGSVCPTQFFF